MSKERKKVLKSFPGQKHLKLKLEGDDGKGGSEGITLALDEIAKLNAGIESMKDESATKEELEELEGSIDTLKKTLEESDDARKSVEKTVQSLKLEMKNQGTFKSQAAPDHVYEVLGGFGLQMQDLYRKAKGLETTDSTKRLSAWAKITEKITLDSGDKSAIEKMLLEKAQLGQSSDIGSKGGFVTKTERRTDLVKVAIESSGLLSQLNNINTTANQYQYDGIKQTDAGAGLAAGVVAGWEKQWAEITETEIEFEKRKIDLFELKAFTGASNRMLTESVINFEQTLKAAMSIAIASVIEQGVLFGTGVGEPEGFFASGSIDTTTRSVALRISAIDVIKMNAHSLKQSGMSPIWIHGPQANIEFPQLNISGELVYTPLNKGLVGDPMSMGLYGHTLHESVYMKSIGTQGDLALVQPKAYFFVTQGERSDTSVHFYFNKDATAFRMVFTGGGHVWLPRVLPLPNDATFDLAAVTMLSTKLS